MAQDLPDLSQTVVQMPSDIREDIAEHARRDLYFFAKSVLGYKDMSPSCHGPLCVFLDQNPGRFKLVMMPRGHYKTSVATISRVMQKVTQNSNSRILLANETTTNAERFLSAIRQHVETNKVFRALFSDIIPKDTKTIKRWSSSELVFRREWSGPEPTIDTVGMTGAMTSRHYTHLTVDDPISEEAAKSEAVMTDTISRIDKFFSLMVRPEDDTFDLIGTRWALFDVYSFFMKKLGGDLHRFVRAATFNGQPIFPELISLETLAKIRETIGEYMYSCLYMNNPRNVAAQNFNVQDLKFWRWSLDGDEVVLYDREGNLEAAWPIAKLDITVSVDLAVAEKITSDYNAIVACGQTPDGRIIVLDVFNRHCNPLEVIEHLFWLNRRYKVRQFGIEGIVYQKAFKYFLRAEADRRNEYLNVIELKAIPSKRGTGSNSKETRIRGLQPVAATGRLYILPTQHELRDQLADFPLGEHDDAIDALAHQLTMWSGLMSEDRLRAIRNGEQKLLWELRHQAIHPGTTTSEPYDPDFDELPRYGEIHEVITPSWR